MTKYQEIYNDVVTNDVRYELAENSPGFRAVVQETDRLAMLAGRSLDIGCGVGFVLEYLTSPAFHLRPFGIDVSDIAVEKAKKRLDGKLLNPNKHLKVSACQTLPFDDDFFTLVTCFDVLEHLDENHIEEAMAEISRVIRPGGTFLSSVSCRRSGVTDIFGDNLHRTVRSIDWWIDRTSPDSAVYDGHRKQLTIWKRAPTGDRGPLFQPVVAASENDSNSATEAHPDHPADSKALYQRIYDDNPWYGDAEKGRCPGVRLLPQYQNWLVGPVIDLGCGRGQTVVRLKELGFQAEGIDQIKKNPAMMVGDISKPIEGLSRFNSAVCVDCIEHLYDEQVEGLFANMKQVQRQAFSIHNGESTGTGRELHVNRRPFDQWRAIIETHFKIIQEVEFHDNQRLYLTESLGTQ